MPGDLEYLHDRHAKKNTPLHKSAMGAANESSLGEYLWRYHLLWFLWDWVFERADDGLKDGMDIYIGVKAGVWFIVVRTVRCQVREDRADFPSDQWLRESRSTFLVSVVTDEKNSDQATFLRAGKAIKVGVFIEAIVSQQDIPPFQYSLTTFVLFV